MLDVFDTGKLSDSTFKTQVWGYCCAWGLYSRSTLSTYRNYPSPRGLELRLWLSWDNFPVGRSPSWSGMHWWFYLDIFFWVPSMIIDGRRCNDLGSYSQIIWFSNLNQDFSLNFLYYFLWTWIPIIKASNTRNFSGFFFSKWGQLRRLNKKNN